MRVVQRRGQIVEVSYWWPLALDAAALGRWAREKGLDATPACNHVRPAGPRHELYAGFVLNRQREEIRLTCYGLMEPYDEHRELWYYVRPYWKVECEGSLIPHQDWMQRTVDGVETFFNEVILKGEGQPAHETPVFRKLKPILRKAVRAARAESGGQSPTVSEIAEQLNRLPEYIELREGVTRSTLYRWREQLLALQ